MENTETKVCSKCGLEKPLSHFYFRKDRNNTYDNPCKECQRDARNSYRDKNKDKQRELNKIWRKENSERIKSKVKSRYEAIKNNQEYKDKKHSYNVNNREKISNYNKSYRLDNYERLKKYDREYEKNKRHTNDRHRILCILRTRLWGTVKKCNGVKQSTIELLGCEMDFFIKYIESLFTNGMTWENYGQYGWHIDHIIPCASFDLTNPDQQKACFHYTNLQPLWWEDNIKKSDKIQVLTSEGVFSV